MIITKLYGGLGNQLFQYALGRSLSLKNDTDLLLDLSFFKINNDHGGYQLDHFLINTTIAKEEDIRPYRVMNTHGLPFIRRIVKKFSPNHVFEKGMNFDPKMLQLSDSKYLNGYWQSEKYFNEYAHIIKEDLALKNEPTGENKVLLEKINSTQAVSLHVRRGDYTSESGQTTHGCCSLDYYRKAIAKMVKMVPNPHFYIFSDDIPWVKENLKLDYPATFVANNSTAPQEDLRLMSNCKHFIIANSTFSWWGAWLSNYEDKKIIAPKQWFADESKDATDLVPEDWIRI